MKQKRLKFRHKTLPAVMILGLGNPGPEYEQSRHNAGFDLLKVFAGQLGVSFQKPWFRPWLISSVRLEGRQIYLVKALTYMNNSGSILPFLMKRYNLELENLMVVVDNMDLPPGKLRMRMGGSSAGHNGLKSIINHLDSSDFKRLYIGVGRPEKGRSVIDHVLGPFSADERSSFEESLERASCLLRTDLPGGWETLGNAINSRA